MIRLLSRSGRLGLMLVGLAGIASLEAAAPVAPTPPAHGVADRSCAVQVELAWMADPITFRCPLRVVASNGAIEVSGAAPTMRARARAVEIACVAAGAPVRDTIAVGHVQMERFRGVSNKELTRDVGRALSEVLGSPAQSVEFSVRGDGQVALRGTSLSLEQRCNVCQRLRHVRGCSCVVSTATVPAIPQTRRAEVLSKPAAIQQVQFVAPETTAPATITRPKSTPVVERSGKKAAVPQKPGSVKPIASPYQTMPQPIAVSSPTTSPYIMRKPVKPVETSSPYSMRKPVKPVETPTRIRRTSANEVADAGASSASRKTSEPLMKTQAEPLLPRDGVPDPVARSTTLPAPSTLSAQPVHAKPIATSAATMQTPRPARFPALSHADVKETPRRPLPDRPYVTTGTVTFHDEGGARVSWDQASMEALKKKLLVTAGPVLKDVEMQVRPDGGLRINLRVPEVADMDAVTSRLLKLEEIQGPDVQLSFQVRP